MNINRKQNRAPVKQTDTIIGYLPHSISVEVNNRDGITALQQLADAVDSILKGEIVLATTVKNSMLTEIPSFCGFSGHELVHTETRNNKHHFWVRKG